MSAVKGFILNHPIKAISPLTFHYRRPGPAVPGYGVIGVNDRRAVVFGDSANNTHLFGAAIKEYNNIEIVSGFPEKEARRSVPDLFNDRQLKGKIAPYRRLGPFFTENYLWDVNRFPLHSASPMVTSTFGMHSEVPLGSLPTTKKGGIIIQGEDHGTTRYEGPTVDQLRKAGINVEIAGVFLATETGYKIVDASRNGDSYVIKSVLKPEEIRDCLLAFYGGFVSGQERKTDNPLGIPVGELSQPPRAELSIAIPRC